MESAYNVIRVGGLGIHQPRRESGGHEHLSPRHHGRLWKTRRAGRVDEHRHVLRLLFSPELVGIPHRVSGGSVRRQLGAENLEPYIWQLLANILADVRGDAGVYQEETGIGAPDAMDQWFPAQVVVDESRLRADGPQGEEQEDKLRRVLEVQGDDVSRADAHPRLEPVPVS